MAWATKKNRPPAPRVTAPCCGREISVAGRWDHLYRRHPDLGSRERGRLARMIVEAGGSWRPSR